MNIGTLEKTATNTQSLKIDFTPEEFKNAIVNVYNSQKGKIVLPGFRKGKATLKMLENYYGENVFYNEAIDGLLKETLPGIVEKLDIDMVDSPKASKAEITKEKGLETIIEFTTKPEISINNYKGLKAARVVESVTDDDVQNVLVRKQNSLETETIITDRPAQLGDIVKIDFKGFCDGEAFEGGEAKNHDLKLGSNQMIPGFEDAIVGHSVGEKFYIDVTFPEEYGMKTLAGKETKFRIKIHQIKNVSVPEIDDEFAKDVTEFDTLEEYKADVHKKLEESAEKAADINFIGDIIEQIVKNEFVGEVPNCMYEQRIDSLIRDFAVRLYQQNLSIEDYLAYTNSDIESLREQYKDRAEADVKVRLALEKIAELENFDVSDEELDKEYAEIAEREDLTVEKLAQYLSKKTVKEDMKTKKANDFLLTVSIVDNTLIKEKEKEELAEAVETMFSSIEEGNDTENADSEE
jgi:trigger factor